MKKSAKKEEKQVKKTETKNKVKLIVQKRNIFGKKLKKLRKEGKLPANIFGEDIKSQAVILPVKEFLLAYRKVGQTQMVFLQLDDEKEEIPVLIQNIQQHPVADFILHADFRKVNLNKKIETNVPLKFIGESEAVTQNKGILLTIAKSLRVEALPGAIPNLIEIDISPLKELNNEIKVKDIKTVGDYVIKENPDKTIIRITAHKEETVETQVVAPEAVEVTTEKKIEGEAPAEGEKPAAVPEKETKPTITPEKKEKK
jgi:large subunit ribosomal protein L25